MISKEFKVSRTSLKHVLGKWGHDFGIYNHIHLYCVDEGNYYIWRLYDDFSLLSCVCLYKRLNR